VTVGSGIGPDLLTPCGAASVFGNRAVRALAGSRARRLPPVGSFAPP